MEWFESAALHALSPGDAVTVAPGAYVISPKIEPKSEEMKYKMLRINVDQISIDVYSEDSHLILKVSSTLFQSSSF